MGFALPPTPVWPTVFSLCTSGGAQYEGIRLSRLFSTGFVGEWRLQTLCLWYAYAYATVCKSGGALYEGIRLSRLFSTGFSGVRRLQTLSVQFSSVQLFN